jgi:hypothetical protein
MRGSTMAIALVGVALTAAAAGAEGPSSLSAGTTGLGDLQQQESKGLDDLERQETGTPDARSSPASLDEFSGGRGDSGSTDAVNRAGRSWSPPPCYGALAADARPEPDAEQDAWLEAISEAEERYTSAEQRMHQAEDGYIVVRRNDQDRSQRATAARGLQEARDDFGSARCALPALIEAARRAGVPPGRLRPYVEKLPAGLRP